MALEIVTGERWKSYGSEVKFELIGEGSQFEGAILYQRHAEVQGVYALTGTSSKRDKGEAGSYWKEMA
jgi:hypothetical protein